MIQFFNITPQYINILCTWHKAWFILLLVEAPKFYQSENGHKAFVIWVVT